MEFERRIKKSFFFRFDKQPQERIFQHRMNGFEANIEHLIYDFNVSLGDTIHYSNLTTFTATNSDTSYITSKYYSIVRRIGSKIQGHNSYRMANSCAFAFPMEEVNTLEGIGSSYGIFGAYDCYLTELTCFRLDGKPLIFNKRCNPCKGFSPTEDNEDKDEIKDIVLFPNPASNQLNIISPNNTKIKEVQLFNNIGQHLRQFTNLSSNIQLEISDLPRGLIFVRIKLDDDRQIVRKVILE